MKTIYGNLNAIDRILLLIGLSSCGAFLSCTILFADFWSAMAFVSLLSLSALLTYTDVAVDNLDIGSDRHEELISFVLPRKANFTLIVSILNIVIDGIFILTNDSIVSKCLMTLKISDDFGKFISAPLSIAITLSLGEVVPKNFAKAEPLTFASVKILTFYRFICKRLGDVSTKSFTDAEKICEGLGENRLSNLILELLNFKALGDAKSRQVFRILVTNGFTHPNHLLEICNKIASLDGHRVTFDDFMNSLSIDYQSKSLLRVAIRKIFSNLADKGIEISENDWLTVRLITSESIGRPHKSA